MGTPGKMVVCPVCGKEFRRSAEQKKFCSVECRNAKGGSSKKKKAGAEPKPVPVQEPPAPKPVKPAPSPRSSGEWKRHPRRCTVCGREFFPEKAGQKMCSNSCRKDFQLRQRPSEKEEPEEDKIPAGAKCETCWRLRRFWNFQELCTLTMQPPKKPCSLWRGSVLYSEDRSSQDDDGGKEQD